MNTTPTQDPSEFLTTEVERLQVELKKLEAERQDRSRIPVLAADANPQKVAEQVTASVAGNGPCIRRLDAAIATLSEVIAAKKRQIVQLQEQEARAAARVRVEAAMNRIHEHCQKINAAVAFIAGEIESLKVIEAETRADRWTLFPYPRSYNFVDLPQNLTLPQATATDVNCYIKLCPLGSSMPATRSDLLQ